MIKETTGPSTERTDLAGAVTHGDRQYSIERAKREWECTVDALLSLVCMLDADGSIVRANRAVESWGLGPVSAALGRSVHDLLHPHCGLPDCAVERAVFALRATNGSETSREVEIDDPRSDRVLHFTTSCIRTNTRADAPVEGRSVLVVRDITALRRAQRALQKANVDLELRVQQRTQRLAAVNRDLRNEIARREQAEQELRASRNDLAQLTERLIHAQEIEQRRIAIELHDSVGQSMSAVKYTLERAQLILGRPELGDLEEILSLAIKRIHDTAEDIRAISMDLRPRVLDDLGAASAIAWLCREFTEIYPNIATHIDIGPSNEEVPSRIATHLYRCVEELINNIAKHAHASNLWLTLRRASRSLTLEVRDDGVGTAYSIARHDKHQGMGLRNLRERAEMTAGVFSYTSAPGQGTTARIVWNLGVRDQETPENSHGAR